MADITVLGAVSAIEEGLAEAGSGSLDYEFKYGRLDIDCDCEEDFLPPAEVDGGLFSHRVLDATMRDTMGFTRKEIVALMGSHTVGRAVEDNAGYDGAWVNRGRNKVFDNFYYSFTINAPWVKSEFEVNGATLTEWRTPFGNPPSIVLNSDAALAFDIEDPSCQRFGGNPEDATCEPLKNAYGNFFRKYAEDNELWLRDYSKVFEKMVVSFCCCCFLGLRRLNFMS